MQNLPRVLFLCIGNACRSPMGEGWLRHLAPQRFRALSGGVHPIGVQPETVQVMAERGVDISDLSSKYVHRLLQDPPEVLIALSRTALAEAPPVPRTTRLLVWPVRDPYTVEGDRETVLAAYRAARDEIEQRLRDWLAAG